MTRSHRVMILGSDNDEVRRMHSVLANAGFLVQSATHPRRALDVDQSWPLDVLVVEENLAQSSGIDLIRALRKRNSALRALIIVDDQSRLELLTATSDGAMRFLCRPFSDDELLQYVQMMVKSAASHDERRDQVRYLSSIEAECWVINPFDDSRSRPIPCMTRDVSRSGLSMLSHQLIPVPTMLKIEMRVLGTARPLTPLAKSLACTMTPIPDLYRIGLKFIGLLPIEVETALAGLTPVNTSTDDPRIGHSYMEALEAWLYKHAQDVALPESEDGSMARQAVDRILTDLDDRPGNA